MGHIVFGGNDRRVFTRLRKARAFVAVYPLFERGHAPRFRVVEIVVQCADRLCKGYYQCPVICCILFHRSSIYCFYYSTIYPVLLGTPPMSGRRRRTIRRPCRGSRIDKAFFSAWGKSEGKILVAFLCGQANRHTVYSHFIFHCRNLFGIKTLLSLVCTRNTLSGRWPYVDAPTDDALRNRT